MSLQVTLGPAPSTICWASQDQKHPLLRNYSCESCGDAISEYRFEFRVQGAKLGR